MREAVLDKSIAVLRQTYIKLVEQGKICNACSDSSDEEAAKKEPAEWSDYNTKLILNKALSKTNVNYVIFFYIFLFYVVLLFNAFIF